MDRIRKMFTFITIMVLLASLVAATSAVPEIPIYYNGSATIGGSPAPIGTVVTAEVDDVEIASTTTTAEGSYGINIGAEYEGDTVSFYLNGVFAGSAVCQVPVVSLDLYTYSLTIASANGSVAVDPADQDATTPGYQYADGTSVELTATADSGYEFAGWSGEEIDGSTDNPVTITMDGNKSVTAEFSETTVYYTLDITATNGSVAVDPADQDATTPGYQYAEGTSVELTATADSGYEFAGWSGDLAGTDNPATITMDGNKSVTAEFSEESQPTPTTYYDLTVTYDVSRGTVSPSSGQYAEGETVSLIAEPAIGYEFAGWSGDLAGTDNPATITMDGDKNISAEFVVATHELIVNSQYGQVSLNPTQPADGYVHGEIVEITVTNLPDGISIMGWQGVDSYSDNQATVTMDADKVVDVLFPSEDSVITSLMPLVNTHLQMVNQEITTIQNNLPQDVPTEVESKMQLVQQHIGNVQLTGNTVYANLELQRALSVLSEIHAML